MIFFVARSSMDNEPLATVDRMNHALEVMSVYGGGVGIFREQRGEALFWKNNIGKITFRHDGGLLLPLSDNE